MPVRYDDETRAKLVAMGAYDPRSEMDADFSIHVPADQAGGIDLAEYLFEQAHNAAKQRGGTHAIPLGKQEGRLAFAVGGKQ